MTVECKFDIASFEGKSLIGMRLSSLLVKKGTMVLGEKVFSGISDMLLSFYDSKSRQHITFNVLPKGRESIAGNLFGFEFIRCEPVVKRNDLLGYNFNFLFNDLTSIIEKIVFVGETKEIEVFDKESIGFWYQDIAPTPKSVVVDKQTLHFFCLRLNENWLYILSGGEGSFEVHFDIGFEPETFAQAYYADAEVELKRILTIQ